MAELTVNYRSVGSTDALKTLIEEKHVALLKRHPAVAETKVTLDQPHPSHENGSMFSVHLEVTTREGKSKHYLSEAAEEDAYVAIREAFTKVESEIKHDPSADKRRREAKRYSLRNPEG